MMSAGWTKRIDDRELTVGVLGLGYVGLPLALAFVEEGFDVLGLDVDSEKVASIGAGNSPITDVAGSRLQAGLGTERFEATDDMARLGEVGALAICVPTPLRKSRAPNIDFIRRATEDVLRHFRPPGIVVLESTTYPGTTEELLAGRFEEAGWDLTGDVILGFSPERIDPGQTRYDRHNTPKVVGGYSEQATQVIAHLYGAITEKIVRVSDARTAEMVKLLENTFRSINIGLANEMALVCERMNVDVWEVIDAAATKPYGFMPFYPGPGLGGHCIPVDPMYLSWKARDFNASTRFIDLADQLNRSMPEHVCSLLVDALNDRRRCVNGSRIVLFGVSYKPNVEDVRESPALAVGRELRRMGAELAYCDPLVEGFAVDGEPLERVSPGAVRESSFDAAMILTDHDPFDWDRLLAGIPLVVDTRNAVDRGRAPGGTDVVRL